VSPVIGKELRMTVAFQRLLFNHYDPSRGQNWHI
jgi:hypothetical protein